MACPLLSGTDLHLGLAVFVSQTLNYFSGHVFDFLPLLARPNTHGFSNILHTFVSWSLFFSIPLFSGYWKPIHFFFFFLDSEPQKTHSLVEPLILSNLFQLACICQVSCRPCPKSMIGRVCFIHSLSVDSLQSLTRLENCSKHFFKEENKNQGSVIEIK